MKPLLLSVFFVFLNATAFAGLQRMNLSDAIRMNVVKAEGSGKGGYTGQALKLKLTNTSGNPLIITVDPGLIFRPADTMQQDLVLAGNEKISIAPFKDATADVQTFCAKSYAHTPKIEQPFSYLKKGSDTLEKVMAYLRQNNLLFSPLAQSAIWVVTNQHGLETVYESNMERQSLLLTDFLSSITGRPKPDYYQVHERHTEPDRPVFNPKVLRIIALFEEKQEAPRKLTLGVYDESGKQIQSVFENRMFGKGGHRFKVDFEAKGAVPGVYFIRLTEGETVLQEKKVVVE